MVQMIVGSHLVGSIPNIDPWGANYVDECGNRRQGCTDCEKLVNGLFGGHKSPFGCFRCFPRCNPNDGTALKHVIFNPVAWTKIMDDLRCGASAAASQGAAADDLDVIVEEAAPPEVHGVPATQDEDVMGFVNVHTKQWQIGHTSFYFI